MRIKLFFVATLLIVIIGFIVVLTIRKDQTLSPVLSQKVTFGVHYGPHSSLIYVALDRGYFKKNRINASIKHYEAGRLAVDALIAGDVDIATAPEFVHVSKSFGDQKLQILATISTADDQEIVARRDRGIKEVKDLAGKKIATAREGIGRFFLETYLTANDIQIKRVVPVNLLPSEMGEAITSGKVDAVTIFAPHSHLIKAALGANAISWSSQNGQSYYFVLTSKERFIRSHGDAIERILRSLLDAERYLKNEGDDARKIIEKRLKISPTLLSSIWPQYKFHVRLDQDLIIMMEDEARWLIRHRFSGGTALPNYFKQIYIDGLVNIAPNAVGVFH